MNIRNCRMCGHIFNYVAGPILCPHCREKMEAKFQEVKEYIRSNPGVGIQDVAENCDVEPSQIQQWLREERKSLPKSFFLHFAQQTSMSDTGTKKELPTPCVSQSVRMRKWTV